MTKRSNCSTGGFLQRLGYDTAKRATWTTEAIGLADGDGVFRHIELLSEDSEGFLRIVLAQVRSVTAKVRNDLVRTLSRFSHDHLIILASDFQALEFVLIDKVKRHRHGPVAVSAYKPVPKVFSVQRKSPGMDLRILRRFTFTQRDALEQFDKLRSVFEAAAYTGEHYQNRALFADHYLNTRLRESSVWAQSPNEAFAAVRQIMADARERFTGKDEAVTRGQLIEPLFEAVCFKHAAGKGVKDAATAPDYLLQDAKGNTLTAALVYQWDRWLDGPDPADKQTPDENPGASVVSILERGDAEWVDAEAVASVLDNKEPSALLAYKDVTSATNQRTMIAAFIPPAGVVNSAPLIFADGVPLKRQCCLLANLNSMAYDFVARQKVGSLHLNFFIVEQLPTLPPDAYDEPCPWDRRQTLEQWISERVLKLSCTSNDMKPLAEACGMHPPVHKWKPDERDLLLAELDAAYFILYGVSREDTIYMLTAFQGTRAKNMPDLFEPNADKVLSKAGHRIVDAYDALMKT